MFGLDIIMAGALQLASFDIQCQHNIAPKIKVSPQQSAIQYDFTKSKDDLGEFDIDTISPYGPQHKTHVGGLMAGEISIEQRVEFTSEVYERQGVGCVHIKAIDVKIKIDPTIYIASEFKKGSCKFNAIMTHEKKHVLVDKKIVNKYASLIGNDLKKTIQNKGVRFGPMRESEIETVQADIQKALGDALTRRRDQMNEERSWDQQAIDTKEEYDSIAAQCPNE
ncbi:MAG: hypothetical protein GW903_00855 [Alphaproteobacteria bacterium]|nr:hypothetical protein [Alphaproteobacteria bacterium]NCQ87519.1 hypothetical protein [Alphaproteobacteria bacterium]NCT06387.1 hypothetical protein [Alphaproteobacteria bacterium]